MRKINLFLNNLKAYDLIVVIFYVLLIFINLIFHSRVEGWLFFILINLVIIFFVFALSFLENNRGGKFWKAIHYWYLAPLILFTFKELYFLIKPIRINDYDQLFIAIDRLIFGADPTIWISQFAHPVLTEILQFVYGLFYFLPIILSLALFKNKRLAALDFAIFMIIYGFFLSYIAYFAMPGVGPRFTLHDFDSINIQLPGIWITNFLREIVNIGESIPAGTLNPAEIVQRDVFPSGHTMITLIIIYLSIKLKSRSRYFLVPIGILLIFSTVYLWYHYVIDLIGGALLMAFSVWSGKYIFNWWQKKSGKEIFEYGKN